MLSVFNYVWWIVLPRVLSRNPKKQQPTACMFCKKWCAAVVACFACFACFASFVRLLDDFAWKL